MGTRRKGHEIVVNIKLERYATIFSLKVVGNENEGGSGRWQMIGIVSDRGDRGLAAF